MHYSISKKVLSEMYSMLVSVLVLLCSSVEGEEFELDEKQLTNELFRNFPPERALTDLLNDWVNLFPIEDFIGLKNDSDDPVLLGEVSVSEVRPSYHQPIFCTKEKDFIKYADCWEEFEDGPVYDNWILYRASGWVDVHINFTDHSTNASLRETSSKSMELILSAHTHIIFDVQFGMSKCQAEAKKVRLEIYPKRFVLTDQKFQIDLVKMDPNFKLHTVADVPLVLKSLPLRSLIDEISNQVGQYLGGELPDLFISDDVSKLICSSLSQYIEAKASSHSHTYSSKNSSSSL